MRIRPLTCALALAFIAAGCGDTQPNSTPDASTSAEPTAETSSPQPAGAEITGPTAAVSPWPSPLGTEHQSWDIEIIDRWPHDTAAFTQGLELVDGTIVESTGRRGESTLRRVGVDGDVMTSVDLDPTHFGEGVTAIDDELLQLTWRAGVALRYDRETLEPTGTSTYTGEGWGICAADDTIWMSNGTAQLTQRDPATFLPLAEVEVRRDNVAIADLNELECIDGYVVANVWHSDEILVIDPSSGAVVATIDAAILRSEIDPSDDQAVLNGIADLGDGTLLLGGKLWPTLFVVRLISSH